MDAIFKCFVETQEEKIARDCANSINKILSNLGNANIVKIDEYWKIKEYFEIQISINNISVKTSNEIRDDYLSQLSETWVDNSSEEEISLLWSYSKDPNKFDPIIKWLNFEAFAS